MCNIIVPYIILKPHNTVQCHYVSIQHTQFILDVHVSTRVHLQIKTITLLHCEVGQGIITMLGYMLAEI